MSHRIRSIAHRNKIIRTANSSRTPVSQQQRNFPVFPKIERKLRRIHPTAVVNDTTKELPVIYTKRSKLKNSIASRALWGDLRCLFGGHAPVCLHTDADAARNDYVCSRSRKKGTSLRIVNLLVIVIREAKFIQALKYWFDINYICLT